MVRFQSGLTTMGVGLVPWIARFTLSAFVFLSVTFGWLVDADLKLREMRYSWFDRAVSSEIVLVDIDAKSLREIGTWPFDRKLHGDLVDKLAKAGADLIAFDIDFSSRSNQKSDAAFADALRKAEGLGVLAAFKQKSTVKSDLSKDSFHYNMPIPKLAKEAWIGTVNVVLERDGKVHAFPFGEVINGEPFQSLPALIAASENEEKGSFLIDYSINPADFQRLSFSDVITGSFDAERLRGKLVLVGASAVELRDFFRVPKHGVISGHTIQALAAETLTQGRVAQPLSGQIQLYLFFGLVFVLSLASFGRRFWWVLGSLATIAIFVEMTAIWLQHHKLVVAETAGLHLLIVLFGTFMVFQEIDLKRLLISVLANKNRNTSKILSTIVTDSFDGIIVLDEDHAVHHSSKEAERLLNRSLSVGDGKQTLDHLPRQIVSAVENALTCDSENCETLVPAPNVVEWNHPEHGRIFLEFIVTASVLKLQQRMGQKAQRRTFACLSFRDITEERLAQEKLEYLAHFDPVTKLPSRHHFKHLVEGLSEKRDQPVAILSLALDRFETVVTALGNDLANKLLFEVGERIRTSMKKPGKLGYLGGTHYALCLTGFADESEVIAVAEELANALTAPFDLDGYGATLGLHIGIAIGTTKNINAERFLSHAEIACHEAIKQKSISPVLYQEVFETRVQTRQSLELDLWKAFEAEELFVLYQPQVRLSDGTPYGAEALVRWQHPVHGLVRPDEFIDIAEQSGLILELGDWVLKKSCRDAATWPDHMKVAVNASALQFIQGDLVRSIDEALEVSGLRVDQLEMEITETMFVEDTSAIMAVIDAIRAKGISFALDDFGTGYSSFGYIQEMPLDKIKIDQQFVRAAPEDPRSLAIVQAIATLANSFDMRTVAEGVETKDHERLSHLAGCTIGQGYLYGKPMRINEFNSWVEGQASVDTNKTKVAGSVF